MGRRFACGKRGPSRNWGPRCLINLARSSGLGLTQSVDIGSADLITELSMGRAGCAGVHEHACTERKEGWMRSSVCVGGEG